VLQRNAGQLQNQVSIDLTSLQNVIATISDDSIRNSFQAKVASAQESFARGQTAAAANSLRALRNEVDAQVGKKLSAATVAALRQLSADALVLLVES
jgi:high-affinity K+ transport system ATPase subunit B